MPPYVQIQDTDNKHYNVSLKKSKRKTIGFVVRKNGDMELRLPYYIPFSEASNYAAQKKEWFIAKHKQMLERKESIITPQYTKDSQIYILGKSYHLKIIMDLRKKIEIKNDTLWVHSHSMQEGAIKEQITNWLMNMASATFEEEIEKALSDFDEDLPYRQLKIRRMKSSWGNMRKSGLMTLNLALIHTPLECIKFVIMHELCHLIHFNHSPHFYRLMDEVMPDWRIYDKQLSGYSSLSL